MPMAGPKGSGLSLMIEAFASVLAANPLIAVAAHRQGSDPRANGLVTMLDRSAFRRSRLSFPQLTASLLPSRISRRQEQSGQR